MNSRIKAAVYFITELIHGNCKVKACYSGAYEPGNTAIIGDEATAMRIKVEEGLKMHHVAEYQKEKLYSYIIENKSTNTKDNIRNTIIELDQQLRTPCNITLITSSFHIARVCEEFSAQTNLNPLEDDKNCSYGIKTLILIGAEGFDGSKFKNDNDYAKQSFFEVYRLMLSNEDLLNQMFAGSRKRRRKNKAAKSKDNTSGVG